VSGDAAVVRQSSRSEPAVRVDARWGSGRGELGRRHEAEGAPEAPMAIAAGGGDAWLLDQVNGRVVHYNGAGRVAGEVRVPETAQDLAVGPGGRLYVLDRIGRAEVSIFDAAGAPITTDGVVGGPIREGGAVTGVFADDAGLYLEREHTDAVRIAGADGSFDPNRPVVPGRPTRDGSAYLRVALAGRRAPLATVSVFDAGGAARWQRPITFPRGVLQVVLLDSDRAGHIYVGAEVADEAIVPPYALDHVAVIVLRLALADGADLGALTLPAPTVADEMLRPLAVDDDGTILQMVASDAGLRVMAYRFP
jgi:hypothetical protein